MPKIHYFDTTIQRMYPNFSIFNVSDMYSAVDFPHAYHLKWHVANALQ